ncbi:Beta-1,4-N-acetylgalactosaminyltransferase bre-4 [Toxocara canis]|uniref:Beta-1,4-N-acetylgalactosaminyltransferase n=1 Tax=Toxocara canis TaxID=6265 RepID=A0A0B2VMZ1_TOXCA|nr:Beta-1,4-N-acetylgalactosaminyltransferase bre-4 [Toxocara canis]KHN84881.1 Beta-1,4-N-acetylgalactosaminyltransferase bre-4 [Toxocara canis]
MNSRLKLVIVLVLCAAVIHFLLSDCPISPDYSFWSPSLFISAPKTLTILESSKADLTNDLVISVLNTVEHGAVDNSSALSPTSFGNWTYDEVALRTQDSSLELCPMTPPALMGPITVWMDAPSFADLERIYPYLEPGGHGMPSSCRARHRVAIIVPYRDRESHLRTLLHNLHSLLMKQQMDYAIFVVEQIANETFNRAKLMNVGYAEAIKLYDWQCFIFHDVDLLPEDDRNLYSCPDQPRHMSVAVDKFHYRLPYGSIFGGISALTRAQFEKINGFSNDYWGWGGEDDDLSTRVTLVGYKISRYPAKIARYKMIKHTSEKENPINKCRYKLMYKTKARWQEDGLSSLSYELISLERLPLYTHIKVDLLENQSRQFLQQHGFPTC